MNNCPMCGVGSHNILCESTAMNGIINETIYHCVSCGASWKEGNLISPVECEVQSQYGVLKDWLVENYAERPDVKTVYETLVNLLTKLDETALRGLN